MHAYDPELAPAIPHLPVMDADPADGTARADDVVCLLVGGHVTNALQHDVHALAVGQFKNLGDTVLAAFGDDMGLSELAAEVGALLVPPHQG